MPYYLSNADGTSLVTVQDGTTNTTALGSLTLVGKNYPTYGQFLNQNLINLLENSFNSTPPSPAMVGQLWYDSNNNVLNFYRSNSTTNTWHKVATTIESTTSPTNPKNGDFWWDQTNRQLKLYDSTSQVWRIIGPQTTSNGQLNVIGASSFNVQIGGNNMLLIDQFGGVQKPLNPCVFGYNNYTSITTLTTAGVNNYLTWKPIVSFDRQNNFDQGLGVFTVTTPGRYRVFAYITSAVTTEMHLQWMKNNASTNITAVSNVAGVSQLVCSGFIQASLNDQIYLEYSSFDAVSGLNSAYEIELVG